MTHTHTYTKEYRFSFFGADKIINRDFGTVCDDDDDDDNGQNTNKQRGENQTSRRNIIRLDFVFNFQSE